MLPRVGLGTSIGEPILYALLILFLSWFLIFLAKNKTDKFGKKKQVQSSKVSPIEFLIIFLINFWIFYGCLIADLVRGWEFLTFAYVFFPLVFLIDTFFFILKMVYSREILSWSLVFFLFIFIALPLIIMTRFPLPKLKE
jgi:hypothetical protein